MIRKTFAALVAAGAVAVLAGCPGGGLPGDLANAIPGAAASMAPGTGTGAACDRTLGAHSTGEAKHGKYNGQNLPENWNAQLADEAAVTKAIDGQYGGANWACFQSFYPGATTVYKAISGKQ